MSVADIIVAVIVVLSGIIALRLGLVRVVLGLAGWVGATLATIYGYSHAQPYAREWIGNDLVADIAAGAAIFVVSMIVLTIISNIVAGNVRESSFGALDRTLGLLAGLAIGGLIVSGAYIFSKQVFEMTDDSEFYRDAKSLPLLRKGASALVSVAPKNWGLTMEPAPRSDSDRTFRSLLTPKTEGSGPERKSGYNSDERQEMDRLIRSHQ